MKTNLNKSDHITPINGLGEGGTGGGSGTQVQSDWNETSNTQVDYIKNKPTNLVSDASYVHTDNNYTTIEKSKLSGIANNANNYILPTATGSVLGGIKGSNDITIAGDGSVTVSTGVLANSIVRLDANGKFSAIDGSQLTNLSKSQIGLTNVLNEQQEVITNKGVNGGYASLDSSGKVPVTQLPIGLVTITSVANQTARLALTTSANLMIALQGDTQIEWMINANQDPSVAGNWINCGSYTSAITSVNGTTSGAVTITPSSIGAVPTTTTVNGHALSTNISVTAGDLSLGTTNDVTFNKLTANTIVGIKPTNYLYVGKNGNDTTGTGGAGDPFLTISAAITAATSGTTIFIFSGTYTENITFKAGVNLTSPVNYGVYITGNHTANFTGTVVLENIILQSTTGITLSFSGTGIQNLQLYNSSINSGSGDAINWTNTNASSKMQIIDGTVNVSTSGTTARAFYSTTGALGGLIANRTTFKIDNPNNICLGIGGGVSFTHTSDAVIGQIVVSNSASATFAIITMTTTSIPVFITNSTGTSTLSEIVAVTTSTPCFSGAGVLVFFAIGYGSTGVGGASTLNGGIGAIPLTMSPVRLRASALSTGVNDGTLEYDGSNLYFSTGTNRVPIVKTTDTQTLTNKTLIDTTTVIANNTDNTKKLQLNTSGITTGTTRTLTVPDTNGTIMAGSEWTAYTPTITCPTTTFHLVNTYVMKGLYKVVGKSLLLKFIYSHADNTGMNEGGSSSLPYQISIPSGFTIDTSKANIPSSLASTTNNGAGRDSLPLGSSTYFSASSPVCFPGKVVPLSSNTLGIHNISMGTANPPFTLWGCGNSYYGGSFVELTFTAEIPIV